MSISEEAITAPAVSGLPTHQLRQIAYILSDDQGDWNSFRWCKPLKRPLLYLRIGFGVHLPESTVDYSPGASQLLVFTMEWPRDKISSGGNNVGLFWEAGARTIAEIDEYNRLTGGSFPINITSEMRETANLNSDLGRLIKQGRERRERSERSENIRIRSSIARNVSNAYMPDHPVISGPLRDTGGDYAALVIDRVNSIAHNAFGMSVGPESTQTDTNGTGSPDIQSQLDEIVRLQAEVVQLVGRSQEEMVETIRLKGKQAREAEFQALLEKGKSEGKLNSDQLQELEKRMQSTLEGIKVIDFYYSTADRDKALEEVQMQAASTQSQVGLRASELSRFVQPDVAKAMHTVHENARLAAEVLREQKNEQANNRKALAAVKKVEQAIVQVLGVYEESSQLTTATRVATLAETEDDMKMAYFGDGIERDDVLQDLGQGSTDQLLEEARQHQLDLLIIFEVTTEERKLTKNKWRAIYADWSDHWPRTQDAPLSVQNERQGVDWLARNQMVKETTIIPHVVDVRSGEALGDASEFALSNLDTEIHRITNGRLHHRILELIKKRGSCEFEQYDPFGFQAALTESMQELRLADDQRENLTRKIKQHIQDIKPDPAIFTSMKFVSTLVEDFGLADVPAGHDPQNAAQRVTELLNGEMTVTALAEVSYYRQHGLVGPDMFDNALLNLLGQDDSESYRSGKILDRAKLLATHCVDSERILAELEELAKRKNPKSHGSAVVSKSNLPGSMRDRRAAQPGRPPVAARSTIQVPARYRGLWRLQAVSFDEGKTVKQDDLSPFVFVDGDQVQSRVSTQPSRRVVEVRERAGGCILVLDNNLVWTLLDTDEGGTKVFVYSGGKETIRYLVVIQ